MISQGRIVFPQLFCLFLILLALLPVRSARSLSLEQESFDKMRQEMVEEQIRARGVKDRAVLKAMERVPRHLFVPEGVRELAYSDGPLPIGLDQTISQPYIVAFMTELLNLKPTDRVLEIGTGSGYQAAVLAEITPSVYSIEVLEGLHSKAKDTLQNLGYKTIRLKLGDGTEGWPEEAPFDKIIVTAAAEEEVPASLIEQLTQGGRMVIPIGGANQNLVVGVKRGGDLVRESVLPVRFVPLITEETRPKDS